MKSGKGQKVCKSGSNKCVIIDPEAESRAVEGYKKKMKQIQQMDTAEYAKRQAEIIRRLEAKRQDVNVKFEVMRNKLKSQRDRIDTLIAETKGKVYPQALTEPFFSS
jgi:phosphotransacetylase